MTNYTLQFENTNYVKKIIDNTKIEVCVPVVILKKYQHYAFKILQHTNITKSLIDIIDEYAFDILTLNMKVSVGQYTPYKNVSLKCDKYTINTGLKSTYLIITYLSNTVCRHNLFFRSEKNPITICDELYDNREKASYNYDIASLCNTYMKEEYDIRSFINCKGNTCTKIDIPNITDCYSLTYCSTFKYIVKIEDKPAFEELAQMAKMLFEYVKSL